jgi:hypothetical protein
MDEVEDKAAFNGGVAGVVPLPVPIPLPLNAVKLPDDIVRLRAGDGICNKADTTSSAFVLVLLVNDDAVDLLRVACGDAVTDDVDVVRFTGRLVVSSSSCCSSGMGYV